jgi:hypothetical protein
VYAAPEARAKLETVGISRICSDAAELASREALPTPGVTLRAGVASPTRAPWIVASGWRFIRNSSAQYVYDVSAGQAPLAAAEAFAYGADAVLKIDAADVTELGRMMTFLRQVPSLDLPAIADIGVVDDGSFVTGEVMNLLARRNLLFQTVKTPSPQFPVNIVVGSKEFPRDEAADPGAFAQKIRSRLTDERRSVRIYGSEVVLVRLTGDGGRVRLHLINYGGRDIEGLRVRVRGAFANGEARVAGIGIESLTDYTVAEGATEFSLPHMLTYAVVDLSGR